MWILHWLYRPSHQKIEYYTGFPDLATERVNITPVLQAEMPYNQKTIDFTLFITSMKTKFEKWKNHVFFRMYKWRQNILLIYKTTAKTFQPRILGPGLQYSAWISYEEPLQPKLFREKPVHQY